MKNEKILLRKRKENKMEQENRKFYKLLILLSAIMFVSSQIIGWGQGLWADELETFKLLKLNHMNFFKWVFLPNGSNGNIFIILCRCWAEIGELLRFNETIYWDKWLLIFPSIISAVSLFFVGLAGKKINNNNSGIICALLYMLSYENVYNSMEFRFYPWLICFMAISIVCYLNIMDENGEKWKNVILYGVSMGMCVNAQVLNAWAFVALGVLDFILWIRHKRPFKIFVAYIIGLMMTVPYLLYLLTLGAMGEEVLWDGGDPTLHELISTIPNIINNDILVLIFCIAFVWSIAYAKVNKKMFVVTVLPVAAVLLNFFATRIFIAIRGFDPNIFMVRYMQYLAPLFIISIGCMIYYVSSKIIEIDMRKSIVIGAGMALWIGTLYLPSFIKNGGPMQGGIEQYTRWIVKHYDEYGDDSLFIMYEANELYADTIRESFIDPFIDGTVHFSNEVDRDYIETNYPKWVIMDSRLDGQPYLPEYELDSTIEFDRYDCGLDIYKLNLDN